MRGFLSVVLCTIVVILCWGTYGPVLANGKPGMPSSLQQFICVGLAYFVIAVIVPLLLLRLVGEKGRWTTTGAIWSLFSGALGAIGALGIIMGIEFRGSPALIMPLVFGGAPVMNTFLTMFMARTYKQVGPIFVAGLLLVIGGAVTVMIFRPHASQHAELREDKNGVSLTITETKDGVEHPTTYSAATLDELQAQQPVAYRKHAPLTYRELGMVLFFAVLTAVSWGAYGPVLHKGQLAMSGSRLRPLLCVGLAYFGIAVVLPSLLLTFVPQDTNWNATGAAWSLGGGAVGALGALGVIMAFNFGGKPIYVMPLVFGLAPVVNTFVSVRDLSSVGPGFYAGLIVTIIGAVTVLLFAPKAGHGPAAPTTAPVKPAHA